MPWLAFCAASLAVAPLFAAEYYFSEFGHDQAGDGTSLNPWRTIGKFNALDLEPGDSVFFRAGEVFGGSMMLDAADTGTDSNGELISPIMISSYGGGPGDRALIRSHPTMEAFVAHNNGGIQLSNLEFVSGGSQTSNQASGVKFRLDQTISGPLTHFNHIRLDNVIARGFQRSGLAFDAGGTVGYQDVEVSNSEFFDNQFAGIEIGAAVWTELIHRDIRINGVTAHNNPGFTGCHPHCGHGIVVGQVDGAVIQNSAAHSNGIAAGKGNVGIWAWQSSNVTIERNTAYGNRSPNGGDGGGFDIDGGVTNSVVQYNTSRDNAGAGYLLAEFDFAEPQEQNTFRYNLSVNDGIDHYGAITIWGADSDNTATSALFQNNTAIVDLSVAPENRGAVWFVNSHHGEIDLINNLFVALNGAALVDGATSPDQARFVNNAYWTEGAPILIDGTTFDSISEWAAASAQEIHEDQCVGIEADPHFGPVNYRPQPPSELIDAGLAADSDAWPSWLRDLDAIDLYGVLVPQGAWIDIGAAEYAPIAGDYNGDQTVDAADYLVWRKSLGQEGTGLAADGYRDGIIDGEDYNVWSTNFGQPNVGVQVLAGTSSANVPEPNSLLMLVLACLAPLRIGKRANWVTTISSVRVRLGDSAPFLRKIVAASCAVVD